MSTTKVKSPQTMLSTNPLPGLPGGEPYSPEGVYGGGLRISGGFGSTFAGVTAINCGMAVMAAGNAQARVGYISAIGTDVAALAVDHAIIDVGIVTHEP